jgi:hypothetical protein
VKPNGPFAAGIRVTREQRIAWDDTSTNPIINSVSCGGDLAHDYSASWVEAIIHHTPLTNKARFRFNFRDRVGKMFTLRRGSYFKSASMFVATGKFDGFLAKYVGVALTGLRKVDDALGDNTVNGTVCVKAQAQSKPSRMLYS